ESLVEQSVGLGKVRAEVSVEMDFNRVTENAEVYDPEGQVLRSTQLVEEENSSSEQGADQSVSVANELPEGQASTVGTVSTDRGVRTEETSNYEISKTVRTTVQTPGEVQRLSVAVLVDGRYDPDAGGEASYQPRSAEELEQIATLVRSAVGFNAERGDRVEVI